MNKISNDLGLPTNTEKPKLDMETVKDLVKAIKQLTKINMNQLLNFAILYEYEDYQPIIDNIFEFAKYVDGYKAKELLEILKSYLIGQELGLRKEEEKRKHFWNW